MKESLTGSVRRFPLGHRPDERGLLRFAELTKQTEQEFRRLYLLETNSLLLPRGGHAHKQSHQIFMALNDDIEIEFDDGVDVWRMNLVADSEYLYVMPGLWRRVFFQSISGRLLVLSTHAYDESDYIRDLQEYYQWIRRKRNE